MKFFVISLLLSIIFVVGISGRQISFTNKCGHAIWIEPLTNGNGPRLADGIVRLNTRASHTYQIPSSEWGGRFWPKQECDGRGENCQIGQSMPPCPNGGCHPPAETKVEFFFPRVGDSGNIWYDVSLVDGYSLPADIVPSRTGGTCRITRCHLPLDQCPSNENEVGDLAVVRNGRKVMCLSPCKKWNYPAPYGRGQSEQVQPGLDFCCPTPPISPDQCRQGRVVRTKYVELVHRTCPTAYSYAYDDEAGLHNCPNNVDFHVTFCP